MDNYGYGKIIAQVIRELSGDVQNDNAQDGVSNGRYTGNSTQVMPDGASQDPRRIAATPDTRPTIPNMQDMIVGPMLERKRVGEK